MLDVVPALHSIIDAQIHIRVGVDKDKINMKSEEGQGGKKMRQLFGFFEIKILKNIVEIKFAELRL